MTAIAGLVYGGKVWIGGDSAGVAGLNMYIRADPKVFRVGPFVIGYTSSFRMGQLLQFGEGRLTLKSLQPRGNSLAFMVRRFVPKMRAILKKGGYTKIEHSVESTGEFLVAWRNHLFILHCDMQVAQVHDPYAACGCARDVVLGSLFSSQGSAEEKIQLALEAAEHYSAGVRRPFVVVRTQ